MSILDPRAVKDAISFIEDGFIFEKFSASFLAPIVGHNFLPVGGLKDKGIDGISHTFSNEGSQATIYQSSIEKNYETKIEASIQKLKDNKISFDRFIYVTNIQVKNKEKLIEFLWEKFKIPVQIFDMNWFEANANYSEATVNAFNVFVESYFHEFAKPGTERIVSDFISDPRLYVFLRQQWESKDPGIALDEMLADTLIIYALEGTDPEKGIFLKREEIEKKIAQHLKFEPKLLSTQIEKRLGFLSRKPNRKINHYSQENHYCLPFETRQELIVKNLRDQAIFENFKASVVEKLKFFLRDLDVHVKDCYALINSALNKLFYKQGLEFAQLMNDPTQTIAFEKSLPETISEVVDSSTVVPKNRDAVKQALLATMRDISYNGTKEQKEFLRSLSNTYMLLFLLQCDPKVAHFFSTMAARLNVYVCTSILIPAFSEVLLNSENRRYWNLLVGANRAGVKLKINDTILDELVGHIRKIKTQFKEEYESCQDEYSDEVAALYVREMLIRAYFYARARGKVTKFEDFLDNFCGPDLRNAKQELIDFLHETFGIRYLKPVDSNVALDKGELSSLTAELQIHKGQQKAHNDANLVLTIFALRETNKESDGSNISGYATWWLSSDTSTQRAVKKLFKDKYSVSCYMRPDFLYNYITLSPSPVAVKDAFADIFPNLLGVNISHSVPEEVASTMHRFIDEHKNKNPGRIRAIIKSCSDKLKSDPSYATKAKLENFLDEELKKQLLH
ncbi:MAG: hypothetical protein JNM24_17665 [Bdellovibrionaceae bacterium]|nr:hypothetical protein [Pseudobdellovibrionaceae bacterium]